MLKTTHHWAKLLEAGGKPAYLMIADLIAEDVRIGRLLARDKLPTLRDLADDLQLNYTTVARGYGEARKRGLIDSHAGMGTFIRGSSPTLPLRGGSGAEMTMNLPPEPQDAKLVARIEESAHNALVAANMYELLRYQDFGGSAIDREIATQWMRSFLPQCQAETLLIAPGIHSVLAALVSQLARPGELICVESLAYPGIKAIAAQFGVKLFALQLDDDGPSPHDFEEACKNLHPKALYCNPTLMNPTTITTSRARREALADIALRYSIPIIEDDAYVMLPMTVLPPMATLAPELTYYISGFSKCYGAGLRSAFVNAPSARLTQRLAGALRATTVMASPITVALTTQAIKDGTAAAVLTAMRDESIARQAMAEVHLGKYGAVAQPEGFHLWLPVNSAWSVVEFASYLRTQGVGVVAGAAFCTDGNPPDAVRVCLGGPMSRAECGSALRLIADTIEHPQHPHATLT